MFCSILYVQFCPIFGTGNGEGKNIMYDHSDRKEKNFFPIYQKKTFVAETSACTTRIPGNAYHVASKQHPPPPRSILARPFSFDPRIHIHLFCVPSSIPFVVHLSCKAPPTTSRIPLMLVRYIYFACDENYYVVVHQYRTRKVWYIIIC